MAGNTLFRPEDRLVWYADWLKFLQEREADLRAQLARQEKSARKAEPPPEAGIAFVSDQAQEASFLDIAFGEQVSVSQAAADEAGADGGVEVGDEEEAPMTEDDAPYVEELAIAADDRALPGNSEDALIATTPQAGDDAPHMKEDVVVADEQTEPGGSEDAAEVEQESDLSAKEIIPSGNDPGTQSPSLPLSTSLEEPLVVDEESPEQPSQKEELA